MSWWRRKPRTQQAGSVLFRGRWPARPEDFAFLEKGGISVRAAPRDASGGWRAELEHRAWGKATLHFHPDMPPPPRQLIDWSARLTREERALAHQAGSVMGVTAEPRSGNVLADRKDLLRFLRAVMGDDGLVAMDHVAQAFWSREGLDDELTHDADLDIDAIYTMHLMYDDSEEAGSDAERRVYWAHSHGLKEIGFREFDILAPARALYEEAHDLVRALAFATVEGRLAPEGGPLDIIRGAPVRAVDARAFHAATPATQHRDWRESVDESHLDGHMVLCDPDTPGFFARLLGRRGPRPSRFLQGPFPEEVLVPLSNAATELMTRRARQTLPLLRTLAEELRDLELPTLVKLGYAVDGGAKDSHEHLWFEVHAFQGDAVDATLINQPFHIARMQQGQRGVHPLELLSDWTIMTPIGRIDPRSSKVLRSVRQNREAFAAALAEMRATGQ